MVYVELKSITLNIVMYLVVYKQKKNGIKKILAYDAKKDHWNLFLKGQEALLTFGVFIYNIESLMYTIE